jgi:hypothetical protein
MSEYVDRCVEEVLKQGHCLIRNCFPAAAVEACRAGFLPLLAEVRQNIPDGNRGAHRWAIGLPFAPPFYHAAFFTDATVNEICGRILGDDMHVVYYGTDTPDNGSEYQKVHADIPLAFPEEPDHRYPPMTLSVRFTFGAMSRDNGPFEVAPGTQHLPRAETLARLEAGELPLAQLLLDVGDVIISDARTPHRGTPNRTADPRPFAVIVYNRSYYFPEPRQPPLEANEHTPMLLESFYQSLSVKERRLLRRLERTPG